MDQQLLSDLCTICHTEKPKYRCPRCKAQTCSLQCYKRHQRRAACSGKRDPAAYVKKSQWATPTGIDRDYNYLKGVERTVHDAHGDVSRRGIGVEHPKSKVTLRAWRPDSSLQQYLTANQITIQHAPKGMSRQKENHTRATKSGNVVWTVEWANEDSRKLQHDCLASQSLVEHYTLLQVQNRNAEKRRLGLERPEPGKRGNKRRRRQVETPEPAGPAPSGHQEDYLHSIKVEGQHLLDGADNTKLDKGLSSTMQDMQQIHDDLDEAVRIDERGDAATSSVEGRLKLEDENASNSSSEKHATPRGESSLLAQNIKTEHHYYLLKPNTIGASRVLIPLDPQSSLTMALRDQIVQEYPTIYVFERPPDDLPDGFLLGAEHLKTMKQTAKTPAGFDISKQEPSSDDFKGSNSTAVQELDPSSILEMLKRDIAR